MGGECSHHCATAALYEKSYCALPVFSVNCQWCVSFLDGSTSKNTSRVEWRQLVAWCKPPWAFMNDLTSGFCDLHTCGETDRLLKTPVESIRDESSTFCKPYVAFMDDFTFGFTTFLLLSRWSLSREILLLHQQLSQLIANDEFWAIASLEFMT